MIVIARSIEYEYRFTEYRFAEYEYDAANNYEQEREATTERRLNPYFLLTLRTSFLCGASSRLGDHRRDPKCGASQNQRIAPGATGGVFGEW